VRFDEAIHGQIGLRIEGVDFLNARWARHIHLGEKVADDVNPTK
jgi:hypothetical protein